MKVTMHLEAMSVSICVLSYMLEAAADARFDVGPPKCGHLPQLPGDLDGFVEQQTELPLVTRVTG